MIERVSEDRHPGRCPYCHTSADSVVVLKRSKVSQCSMLAGQRNVRRMVRYYQKHHPDCPTLSENSSPTR